MKWYLQSSALLSTVQHSAVILLSSSRVIYRAFAPKLCRGNPTTPRKKKKTEMEEWAANRRGRGDEISHSQPRPLVVWGCSYFYWMLLYSHCAGVYIWALLQSTLGLAIYHSNDLGKKYTLEYLMKSCFVIPSLISSVAQNLASQLGSGSDGRCSQFL